MTEFKSGDRVRMNCPNGTVAYGQVTIVTEYSCKVLFDREEDPTYWYYMKEDLELVPPGEDVIYERR